MSTNYVLVDFENLQPDMSALAGTAHKVVVFFGAKQQTSRHHFEKFDSLFELGSNLVREKILHSGKNALDMHIAYYLGRIFEREPTASVQVISRDTDFDPLLEYLRAKGFSCSRSKEVVEVARPAAAPRSRAGRAPRKAKAASAPASRPAPGSKAAPAAKSATTQKPAPAEIDPDHLGPIIAKLRSMGASPPKTRKALEKTIAGHFKHHGGARADGHIGRIIDALAHRGLISLDGNKVAYSLG